MYPQNTARVSTFSLVLMVLVAVLAIITATVFQTKSAVSDDAAIITASSSSLQPKLSSLPSFSGFESLVDKGLADDQLTGLQYAFGQLSKSLPTKLTKVSISQGTIVVVPRDRNSESPINVMRFTVSTNSGSYDAEVDYSSLSAVELKVFDHVTGATLFDSGVIDINTQTPAD